MIKLYAEVQDANLPETVPMDLIPDAQTFLFLYYFMGSKTEVPNRSLGLDSGLF